MILLYERHDEEKRDNSNENNNNSIQNIVQKKTSIRTDTYACIRRTLIITKISRLTDGYLCEYKYTNVFYTARITTKCCLMMNKNKMNLNKQTI